FLNRQDMDWFAGHYLDGADVTPEDPAVSPLLAEDLSGLPPALSPATTMRDAPRPPACSSAH
ncbi:alpha/beta hydrolase fold domain-containing protein, partial [Mycolicibacterium smegmatis]|uniref:alpha/beta hydrolase fold domain-containing protein n=1 Tax=Mycolicibacterium smegmatis TaxID=1772 RepID=UPI0023DA3B78